MLVSRHVLTEDTRSMGVGGLGRGCWQSDFFTATSVTLPLSLSLSVCLFPSPPTSRGGGGGGGGFFYCHLCNLAFLSLSPPLSSHRPPLSCVTVSRSPDSLSSSNAPPVKQFVYFSARLLLKQDTATRLP